MSDFSQWHSPFSISVKCRLLRSEEGKPKSLLVALHGMGQNSDLMARAVRPLCHPDRAILIPDAPLPFEKLVSGGRRKCGRAWYIYTGDQDEFLESARLSAQWLETQITRAQSDLGLESCPVDLLGYSQGGYLAAILAFDSPSRFRSLVSCCSRMKTEILPDRQTASIPVLVVHGEDDPSVPVERSRESAADLSKRGWNVDFRAFPNAGHRMEPEQWQAVATWLALR